MHKMIRKTCINEYICPLCMDVLMYKYTNKQIEYTKCRPRNIRRRQCLFTKVFYNFTGHNNSGCGRHKGHRTGV